MLSLHARGVRLSALQSGSPQWLQFLGAKMELRNLWKSLFPALLFMPMITTCSVKFSRGSVVSVEFK